MAFKNPPTLDGIRRLAETFRSAPDTRPKQLTDMTALAPTTDGYNRFLYEFTREFGPTEVVETGTDRGRSAAHFAAGGAGRTRVATIDIDPACSKEAGSLGFENIVPITADAAGISLLETRVPDVLFIDSLHTYEQASAEYGHFRPWMSPGAVVFMDDIHIDAGMERFWREVADPKVDLSGLHYSGFGAAIVS